jgi:hypothetical protein
LEHGLKQPYHEPPRRIDLVLPTLVHLLGSVLTSVHPALFFPTQPKLVCSDALFPPHPRSRRYVAQPRPFQVPPVEFVIQILKKAAKLASEAEACRWEAWGGA